MTSREQTKRRRTRALAWIVGVAALAVFAPATSLAADELSRIDEIAKQLGLDDSARAAIRELAEEARDKISPLRQASRRERMKLRVLLEEDHPDEAAVMAQLDEVVKTEREMWRERLRALIEIRGKLTPAQREDLVQMRRRQFARTQIACREDARLLCPAADTIPDIARCLVDQRARLSKECREALEDGPLGALF